MVVIESSKIKELIKKYHENKLSHAFLFVTNDLNKCRKDIKEFIKQISCPQNYQENCEECNLCYQIENNIIPNIKEIYPEGQLIKKNQILELKDAFKAKPLYITNNIYIINNAEKLNSSSANTMLKFLEEPEANILGFFLTNNKEAMLETIKSRCQIINIRYENQSLLEELNSTAEEIVLFQKLGSSYLLKIINKEENGIYLNKKVLLPNLPDRLSVNKFFNYLYLISNEIINQKNIPKEFAFLENMELKKLISLQKALYNVLERIAFNVNIELLLDNFVLEMEKI